MAFSHRDRRAHREIERGLGLLAGGILGLSLVAILAPEPWVGLSALLGLVLAGLVAVAWGQRLLIGYARDLRSFREGGPPGDFGRFEAASRIGLERPVGGPSRRSPHSRGPRAGAPDEGPEDAVGPGSEKE